MNKSVDPWGGSNLRTAKSEGLLWLFSVVVVGQIQLRDFDPGLSFFRDWLHYLY